MRQNYFENEYCEFWIDEIGIIHEIFKPTFDVLTLEIAKEIVTARLKVSNGISRPLYVELGTAVKMSMSANKYFSSPLAMKYLTGTGILVRDEIERFGAILYTKFSKPIVPTKYFTNKKKALMWLKSQRVENLN